MQLQYCVGSRSKNKQAKVDLVMYEKFMGHNLGECLKTDYEWSYLNLHSFEWIYLKCSVIELFSDFYRNIILSTEIKTEVNYRGHSCSSAGCVFISFCLSTSVSLIKLLSLLLTSHTAYVYLPFIAIDATSGTNQQPYMGDAWCTGYIPSTRRQMTTSDFIALFSARLMSRRADVQ